MANHAVISVPDQKKGEALILVTDKADAQKGPISKYAKEHGISELSVPRQIKVIEKMPILPTGKVDDVGVKRILEE